MCQRTLIFFLLLTIHSVISQLPYQLSNLGHQQNPKLGNILLQLEEYTLKLRMIFGENGKTLINFKDGKTLIAKSDERFECTGKIQENGDCNGNLTAVDYNKKENFCYVLKKVKVNDQICLTNGFFVETNYNNKTHELTCFVIDVGVTYVMKIDEYKKMCGNLTENPTYTYYQDVKDPLTIPIANVRSIVDCQNNETNVCEFTFDEPSSFFQITKFSNPQKPSLKAEQVQLEQLLLMNEAILINFRMIFGDNGKTVINFNNGKTLLAKDDKRYECDGKIQENGECNGTFTPVNYDVKENFCYVFKKLLMGNQICLTTGYFTKGNNIEEEFSCEPLDDGKVLLMNVEDYKEMCGNNGDRPTYKYIADVNDPLSVKIPYPNFLVECENIEENVCVFSFELPI